MTPFPGGTNFPYACKHEWCWSQLRPQSVTALWKSPAQKTIYAVILLILGSDHAVMFIRRLCTLLEWSSYAWLDIESPPGSRCAGLGEQVELPDLLSWHQSGARHSHAFKTLLHPLISLRRPQCPSPYPPRSFEM